MYVRESSILVAGKACAGTAERTRGGRVGAASARCGPIDPNATSTMLKREREGRVGASVLVYTRSSIYV